jgi:hypothetical protein
VHVKPSPEEGQKKTPSYFFLSPFKPNWIFFLAFFGLRESGEGVMCDVQ